MQLHIHFRGKHEVDLHIIIHTLGYVTLIFGGLQEYLGSIVLSHVLRGMIEKN